jgi:hypothetical protein
MNEQEYIESMNQLKDKFNDNELIKKKYIRKYNEIYKTLSICYGLVRCYVDNNHYHCEHDILIGELRAYLSTALFQHLEDCDTDDE